MYGYTDCYDNNSLQNICLLSPGLLTQTLPSHILKTVANYTSTMYMCSILLPYILYMYIYMVYLPHSYRHLLQVP